MARRRDTNYRSKWEAACVTIVELQQQLEDERKRRRAAERRGTVDALTRLYTRRAFDQDGRPRFQRAKRGKTSVAMIFIDANGFKSVNDSLGHAVGDKLLVAIATALKRSKRPADLAARKGGDEFVLFFEGLIEAKTAKVIERIHEAVSVIRLESAPDLRASVSIGVAVGVPSASLEWADLISQADKAMYEAKTLKGTDRPTVCIRPLT